MSVLKWKIRFKGILERKPCALLIFHVSTIDAFVVRLLNALCQMPDTSCLPLWSAINVMTVQKALVMMATDVATAMDFRRTALSL